MVIIEPAVPWKTKMAARSGILGLGSRLYPGNMQRIFNKDLTRFMQSLSRERQNRASKRKALLAGWKLHCYAREFFFSKTFHRSILSWVPVLRRQATQNRDQQNFSSASQHHMDFTCLDHLWPRFLQTRITCCSYNPQSMMKWKNSQCKKLSFLKVFFPCVLSAGSS